MKGLMQRALGDDWGKLPPALQAHYHPEKTSDIGHMSIDYPRFMLPYFSLLHLFGALVNRHGQRLPTVVEKNTVNGRQSWQRTIHYPNGKTAHFNSNWTYAGGNQIIEFVNPLLGLQMAVHVKNGQLHYHGVKFVVKFGLRLLPIPECLIFGHTKIIEVAIDETHFTMDFRVTHPLFGQLFRYSGEFEALAH